MAAVKIVSESRQIAFDFVCAYETVWCRVGVVGDCQSTMMKMWSAGMVEGTASKIQGCKHAGRFNAVVEGWIRRENESRMPQAE